MTPKFAPEVATFLQELAARDDVKSASPEARGELLEQHLNDFVERIAAFAVAATARRLGVSEENARKTAEAFLADRELDTTPARLSAFLPVEGA